MVRLSLVIPAYNEAQRIAPTLRQCETYLALQPYSSEVTVVDDGSVDGTADLVAREFPEVRLLRHGANQGKGAAVRTGMRASTGAYRLFLDADGSTPIEELDKVWPLFEAGADVVIGSRGLPASDVRIRQHPVRESMGRLFNVLVRALLREQAMDTQCGFKVFTGTSAEVLFGRQRLDGFSFDAELLYLARKHRFRVVELPVIWLNSPKSRVHILFDSLAMLRDLFRIRLNDLAGRYK